MSTARITRAFFRSLTLKSLLVGASVVALGLGLADTAVAGCASGDVAGPGEVLLTSEDCQADASGSVAVAVGPGATATGSNAVALGTGSAAHGNNATALGYFAGSRSVVVGATNVGALSGNGGAGYYSTAVEIGRAHV